MGDLVGPVIQLLQWIAAPISRCWKHYSGLKENVETLNQRMEELNSRKTDIHARLATEVVQGETKSKDEVQLWLQRVEDIATEINIINRKVETVKWFSRAGLGKSVIQKIEEVDKLHTDGEFPNGLVVELPQQIGEIIPTPTLGGGTTLERNIEEVWAFLMGDEVGKIGIYGMGGIGKTTIMKRVNNRLLEKKEKFGDVIWVTVSKASSILKLQDAIAREIKFDISKYDDETRRASKLYAELSKRKRYVLILDDLWDVYRLDLVGIPELSPENGNKLVLTTRRLDVCLGMSCKPIPMERLSKSEALDLFLVTVGRDVLSIPGMEKIVNLVAEECACLPLAIITIAGSLKGKVDYNDWKTALEDLKASTKGANEIFEKLKFSYDRLEDENHQACLLYCALFPEDYDIERNMLIEYLIAEEIVKGRNRQAELEKGQAMLNKLVNSCLLEDTRGEYGMRYVKMHDLIREMALQITSDCPRFLVEAGTGLKCIPDEDDWNEDLAKVSLMHNSISDIPSSFESPKCPKISTLLVTGNFHLSSIADNFFLHMKGLTLLDLSYTSIKNLPESISELVNLIVLLLRGCGMLTCMPSFAKLKGLKRLDFSKSGIKQLPQGMENLIRLRYLEFGGCEQLEIIPDGILCKLINLRYLSLDQVHSTTIKGEELVYLRKLEELYCVLHDADSFNAYVRSLMEEGPTHYKLQLGFMVHYQWGVVNKGNKFVYLTNWDGSKRVATSGDCLLLPQDVEILTMDRCRINASSLCEFISFEHVTNVTKCYVNDCGELEHLFVYSPSIIRFLQRVEELVLRELSGLRGLIRRENAILSPLRPDAFSSLKQLDVSHCRNVKRLINAPLPNLEYISVCQCEQLVEIVSTTHADEEEDEETDGSDHQGITVTLPKLWHLVLYSLPKLKSIPLVADRSLRQVDIRECPKLKRVPCLDRDPCPPSLEYVEIGEDLWESLEWNHQNAKDTVQSIRRKYAKLINVTTAPGVSSSGKDQEDMSSSICEHDRFGSVG